jgi:hypothetical protein
MVAKGIVLAIWHTTPFPNFSETLSFYLASNFYMPGGWMKRGLWLIVVLAALPLSGCGGRSSPPPVVTISVSPTSVTLAPNASQVFSATVTNTTDTAVTWQVNNVNGGNATAGTINASGMYIAPATEPSPPTVSVKAVSQADPTKSASSIVTIAQPAGATNQARQTFPIKLGTSGGDSLDSTTAATLLPAAQEPWAR